MQRIPLDHPIIVIGAGGIVRDAHLPAYSKAGFRLAGIYDLEVQKAKTLADQYGIPRVFATLYHSSSSSTAVFRVAGIYDLEVQKAKTLGDQYGIPRVFAALDDAAAAATPDTVFDVAVPAAFTSDVLRALPDGHGVLIQKPMRDNIEQARTIRDLCRAKKLTGAVNFQLRFAPAVTHARRMIDRGSIGELSDVEVRITAYTPWQMWPFLEKMARVEILYHSIHYIDLIRSFLGDPKAVYAKSTRRPVAPKLASCCSSIIMDYGDMVRANIQTNSRRLISG